MHLLATTSGVVDGGADAVDLKQPTGDIIILSAADSEIANLALASDNLEDDGPSIRLANLLQLQHNYSVDLYTEKTLAKAKLVIVRLLGGKNYWPYGVARLVEWAKETGGKLVLLPGGTDADSELQSLSTIPHEQWEVGRRYFAVGGAENAVLILQWAFALVNGANQPRQAAEFSAAGYLHLPLQSKQATATIVFYRSNIEGGQTVPILKLVEALTRLGSNVSAIYVASLKDKTCQNFLSEHFKQHPADVIINATSFAVGDFAKDILSQQDCPVLQVTLAGSSEETWQESSAGLLAKDLAMSVVLPELDGRIYAGVISFKADHLWHEKTQCRIVTYQPQEERIHRVAEHASNWAKLRHISINKKHIAIILANYPNKDGRIANGVGFDTPQSTINILRALHADEVPANGNALIEALQANFTNASRNKRSAISFDLDAYEVCFQSLPPAVQDAVTARWGAAIDDPLVFENAIQLPFIRFGKVVVGIQPARGYNIDPKATYHDPALVPPHNYIAAYMWLREVFGVDAIIHNGKHGNLEWLPGKSVGLSENCFPDAILGRVPHFYPFIVNDPGEGTAAKRRTSAVIIDHLTPPLTRAESYGPLKDLEALVDEYYLASGLDRRRLAVLKEKILDLTRHHKLDKDAGFTGEDDADLQKLDTFLCDLKEAQIRDGLHILGESPTGQQETDLLVALTRTPRGTGEAGDASLIRALSEDFKLGFDPLNCVFAEPWDGPRPVELANLSPDAWRTNGDTVERLELLASQIVASSPHEMTSLNATQVVAQIENHLRPTLASCGASEMQNLLRGLQGKRVPPGASGAPTRGRLDVLPTGRNFYSIDNRTLPTPAAWQLGKASADALLLRHFQDTGQHLKNVGLSCWGTANMRTGGDDLAQAMWLLGVKPVWDTASWRVTGFEVQPLAALGRPRVDVTLRISGLFRDAFPVQIELLDKAIQAVAQLDEDADDNPLSASLTTARIFGSKPGAYGAGLQALIDEGIWEKREDLAKAYVTWGAYVYGAKEHGRNDEAAFTQRLQSIEAVIHNQDNREHDLLDSDDYYQFEGGMSAAVETASGKKPKTYHNDHSRPERPIIRTLEEEVSRVMRSRVVNPKWINGVKRHGYKGAFEIAATVDYMFAFAATADAVKSHHFDIAYDAYIDDEDTRTFLSDNNPAALKEIAARFEEAITRGLWQPRRNSAYATLKALQS
jgi:cobaltochelatase CobN